MTLLRCIILLQFTATLALGQAQQGKPSSVPKLAEATVRSLYREVVTRQPIGIPKEADMKTFAPYLTKSLLHRIALARGCEDDYHRGHQNPNEKPQLEWLEFGLFTGANEKVSPRAFHVERTQHESDGSLRVYVTLTWGSPANPWNWHVAAVVLQESGHFVVDDVIFLKDEKTLEDESRLSETLAAGCDGPRWVGYGKQPNDPKQKR